MGASGWLVITPWQQDLAASLRTAQREIFTAGNFQDPLGIVEVPAAAIARLDAFELPSDLPPEDRADLLAFLEEESAQQRSAIARYQSAQTLDERIAALRLAAGAEGTHSVMDLPGIEALSPIDPVALISHFGTEHPDLDTVRADGHELEYLVSDRGCGVWFITQDAQQVDWLVIIGVSGD
jgi:hypothetical protein